MDKAKLEHQHQAERWAEQLTKQQDLVARAGQRFSGMDTRNDPFIARWRGQAARGKTRYLGSV